MELLVDKKLFTRPIKDKRKSLKIRILAELAKNYDIKFDELKEILVEKLYNILVEKLVKVYLMI